MQFEIKPVTLDDKPIFDRYFSENDGINSEYTFTNMFMWRKSYSIRYAIIDGFLCVFSKHHKSPETVNFPLGKGDITPVITKLIEYFEEINQKMLIRIYSDDEISRLENAFPKAFILTEDRNSFDYVYKVQDLIELSGNRYHQKRNHINKFLSLYPYEYHNTGDKYLSLCYEMFNRWCESKTDTIPGIWEQHEAVTELFSNLDTLNVKGGLILSEGKVVAFSFGEVLSQKKSVAVIHIEHADTDFQGSFPLINQQFLENEWQAFEFVNREEDMGLSGLRKAKKSYHPEFMVKKYIASLK